MNKVVINSDMTLNPQLGQTNSVCAACKRPIDRNNIRSTDSHEKEARVGCSSLIMFNIYLFTYSTPN